MNKMQTNLEIHKSKGNISISILKEGRDTLASKEKVLWNNTSYDVGYGALAARVIRPAFDSRRMDYCVEQMKEVPNEPIVGHRRLADLLNKLDYKLTLNERREATSEVGCLTNTSMVEVVPDPARQGLWILFYGGAPTAAKLINDAGPAWYLDADSYLRDLFLVQQIGRLNRMACVRRLLELYYGNPSIEESVYCTFDFPYHTVDIEHETIHWSACHDPKLEKFLKLTGNRRVLYRFRYGS